MAEQQALERMAQERERLEIIKFMLKGPQGRRELRRQLYEASFDVSDPGVPIVFDRHAGEMARNDASRAPGVQLIWTLLRMLAHGELPLSDVSKLMTEQNDVN